MLTPNAIDAIRKPPAVQPSAVPLRIQTFLVCDAPPTSDLQIFWQQLLPNKPKLVEPKSGEFSCSCRHRCGMECSRPRSRKQTTGERKTSLDNANMLGSSSSTTLSGDSGGGASSGSGSAKGRRQRRRSKKDANGRTTDSTSSPPAAPDVAAPRFTRNYDHLRLLLDAFQAAPGSEGAPLMVLRELFCPAAPTPQGCAVS